MKMIGFNRFSLFNTLDRSGKGIRCCTVLALFPLTTFMKLFWNALKETRKVVYTGVHY